VALQMAAIVKDTHPRLARFLRLPEDVDWQCIAKGYFTQD
jgi:hypothetical protein